MVPAAQQDTARLLRVVLIIGVNRRYSLLGVAELGVLLDMSQLLLSTDECGSDMPPFNSGFFRSVFGGLTELVGVAC
jgi:hypothetical protein